MLSDTCRLCRSRNLQPVVDLGLHPLADTFLNKQALAVAQPRYPLGLTLCLKCGYVMSSYIISAQERYQKNEYSYDSSNSPVAIKHFAEMAVEIAERVSLGASDLVVDIGSNAGTLLGFIKEKVHAQILGIEPSLNMTKIAEKNGIPTLNSFFNEDATRQITNRSKAKVITATNVFNHIEDVESLMKNISNLLVQDGQFVFETPYLVELIERGAFDTIYLEHVSYFSVKPHTQFFKKFGLYVYHLECNMYMGGSIRVFLGKDEQKENKELLEEFSQLEDDMKLADPVTYAHFMEKIERFKDTLRSALDDIKSMGGKIIGIGAATKGNTLLNYCGIDTTLLDYIAESSPLKIGKYTPGSGIEIIDEKDIGSDITHMLILPWNIAQFLIPKFAHYKAEFIVPHM